MILSASVFFLAALAAGCGVILLRRESRSPLSLPLLFVLSLFLAVEAIGSYFFPGRAILELGLFQPASFFSRISFPLFTGIFSTILRRVIDPAVWFLLLSLLGLGAAFFPAAVFFAICISLECLALSGLRSGLSDEPFLLVLHHACLLLSGIFFLRGLALALLESPILKHHVFFLRHAVLFIAFFSAIGISFPYLSRLSQPLSFAHYYSWFPENWVGGHLGQKLHPPLLPELGEYRSDDASVIERHEIWAKQAGLSGFVLDWWPSRRALKQRVLEISRRFSPDLMLVLLYETLDLRQPHEALLPGERPNIVFLSSERAKNMGLQWARIVEDYMKRPNYLRIGKRPVLFLYATRHLLGDIPTRIREAREIVREKTGFELFLVADEPYFEVMEGDDSAVRLLPKFVPNWDRLRGFDAFFVYNPYDNSRKEHSGSNGALNFLSDTSRLFRRYQAIAASAGIPFFPAALVGFNDRAHRLREDHFIVPRELPTGESFLKRTLSDWVKPRLVQSQIPLFTITSWNEWNEGSQIEPVQGPPEVRTGPDELLLGEIYRGYGNQGLLELSTFNRE